MQNLLKGSVIHYRPDDTAGEGEILIGIGSDAGLVRNGNDSRPSLILNHKGTSSCKTGAAFVWAQVDDVIEQWRREMALSQDAAAPFSGSTIVVQDASPDTCLTLIALYRRLSQVPLDPHWIDYVAAWEAGQIIRTGIPSRSAGALLSALTHAKFDRDAGILQVGEALTEGVNYLDGLISAYVNPCAVPEALSFPLHVAARARLAAEEQRYRRMRDAMQKFQLSVPVAGTQRRRIVDAAIISETTPTGALKSFLRHDAESFTGDGYALMALHRPTLSGFGGNPLDFEEMSVSVEPDAGVHLFDLWHELELREDKGWASAKNGERPRSSPRRIKSFDHISQLPAINPSNEPWWDDNGRYTLVASPRQLSCGTPGSKLKWQDVLDAIWLLYAPGREIHVCRRTDPDRKIVPLLPNEASDSNTIEYPVLGSDRALIDVVRVASGVTDPILWTPTLARAMAGLTYKAPSTIDNLPSERDFDVLMARGGTAVVTPFGLVLLEHSPGQGFPADKLRKCAIEASDILARVVGLEERLAQAEKAVETAVGRGSSGQRRSALSQIYRIMLEALPAPKAADVAEPDPMVRQVREAIEHRWGAAKRFQYVSETARTLEAMIVSSSNVRNDTLLSRVAIYGLPAAVFGNILGVAFNPIGNGGGRWVDIAWPAVAWYVGLTASMAVLLKLIDVAIKRSWQKSIEESRFHR